MSTLASMLMTLLLLPSTQKSSLIGKYQFKLKGTGPISFHLGCNFVRDKDGTMCMSPRKYLEKFLGTYEFIFGSKPKQNITSPLEKGDHPELDMSNELDTVGIKIYQHSSACFNGLYPWARLTSPLPL